VAGGGLAGNDSGFTGWERGDRGAAGRLRGVGAPPSLPQDLRWIVNAGGWVKVRRHVGHCLR